MDYFPGNWGNPRLGNDDAAMLSEGRYGMSNGCNATAGLPASRTQQPVVTGTSVLAIKYKDGVMMAADTLASYGSLARFRDVERIIKVGDYTLVGASGDISDFQYLTELLQKTLIRESNHDDGHKLGAPHIHEYLSRVMYARRSKINPLWNSLIVAGYNKGQRFLGFVDLQGTTYHASTIATGYGAYIAQPILRKAVEGREDELTAADAEKILNDCMRVLYYRDARSSNKIIRGTISVDGLTLTQPYDLETEWGFAETIRGYGANPE